MGFFDDFGYDDEDDFEEVVEEFIEAEILDDLLGCGCRGRCRCYSW